MVMAGVYLMAWKTVAGAATSTLNGALLNDTNGTGGSGTNITLASTTNFTSAGRILVEEELISYASIAGANLQTIVREVNGTRQSCSLRWNSCNRCYKFF